MSRRVDLGTLPCSIARSLAVVGEWWTPLVLRDVFYGLRRFEQIATDLPIARNTLAARLAHLVDEGVLERRRYAVAPDRFEYHLTEKGDGLLDVLLALMAWGDRWTGTEQVPPVSVVCRSCNHETVPQVTCSRCTQPLTSDRVGVRPNLGQATPHTRLALRRR